MTWLTGWNYRKQIIIDGSTAGAQSDYQMKLTVNQGSGTDSTGIVYLSGNILSNFNDLRFTKSDGSTLLNYWIESITGSSPNQTVTVWIKLAPSPDVIPASPDTYSFYIYYNNTGASAASDINTTFIRVIDYSQCVKAAWSFDEASGTTTNDNSGNGNTGTLNGGITRVTGKFGGAYNFNGSTGYVSVGDLSTLSFANNIFTFSFWMKAATTTGNISVLSKRGGIGGPWEYSISGGSGVLGFSTWNSGGYDVYTGASSTYDTNWTYFVFAADGTNAILYKNGVSVQTVSKSSNTMSDTAGAFNIGIGGGSGATYYMNGIIDEVRVYNYALSASDITDLYNNYGYVTPNYPGRELVRKYVSPEPTFSISGAEETLTGDLDISSTPIGTIGAFVYIDRNVTPSGTTPLIVTGFTPGTHTYRLTKTGYTEIPDTDFIITAGQTTTVSQAMLTVANIGATSIHLDSITTPCVLGSCIAVVSETWKNTGESEGLSDLSITVSEGTHTITPPVYSSVSFMAGEEIGPYTFRVSDLSSGNHSICPDPN